MYHKLTGLDFTDSLIQVSVDNGDGIIISFDTVVSLALMEKVKLQKMQ